MGLSEKSERDRLIFFPQTHPFTFAYRVICRPTCSNIINGELAINKCHYNFYTFSRAFDALRDFIRRLERKKGKQGEKWIDWSLFYFEVLSEIDFFFHTRKRIKKVFLHIFQQGVGYYARTVQNYA